ncbi:MAG: beta-lactamase family protein [Deltaproteobacteria bacterium]|jgi:CubicO group peptidase (beta-lactamase class C family)|nr:beta-lactamase family protein [Deltaproteobacteria bacterium]
MREGTEPGVTGSSTGGERPAACGAGRAAPAVPADPPPLSGDIAAVLDGAVLAGVTPGGVLGVSGPAAGQGGAGRAHAFGRLGVTRDTGDALPDDLYDLASVTKIVSTAFLCMLARDRGLLPDLDAPLSSFGWEGPPDTLSLTVRNLLSHRSGLPAWRPLYLLPGVGRRERALRAREAILRERPLFPQGEATLYSDLGFVLLGFLLEDLFARPLESIFREEIAVPLGLAGILFSPRQIPPGAGPAAGEETPAGGRARRGGGGREIGGRGSADGRWDGEGKAANHAGAGGCGEAPARREALRIAPTEDGFRCGGPLDRPGVPHLGPVPPGRVHDDNAAWLGGAAGHAGLFARAADAMAVIGSWQSSWVDGGGLISLGAAREFLSPQGGAGTSGRRGLGFDCQERPGGGGHLFGHKGYTGPTVWFEPGGRAAMALLCNRVHPTARRGGMDAFREKLLELVFPG